VYNASWMYILKYRKQKTNYQVINGITYKSCLSCNYFTGSKSCILPLSPLPKK
jgi:hypothetical protein